MTYLAKRRRNRSGGKVGGHLHGQWRFSEEEWAALLPAQQEFFLALNPYLDVLFDFLNFLLELGMALTDGEIEKRGWREVCVKAWCHYMTAKGRIAEASGSTSGREDANSHWRKDDTSTGDSVELLNRAHGCFCLAVLHRYMQLNSHKHGLLCSLQPEYVTALIDLFERDDSSLVYLDADDYSEGVSLFKPADLQCQSGSEIETYLGTLARDVDRALTVARRILAIASVAAIQCNVKVPPGNRKNVPTCPTTPPEPTPLQKRRLERIKKTLKLSEEQLTQKQIAIKLGVDESTVSRDLRKPAPPVD